MFEDAVYEAASEMDEVESVEYVDASSARVSFFSNSRKSTYSYEFILSSDGIIEIQSLASGPYLSANAPRQFAELLQSHLN